MSKYKQQARPVNLDPVPWTPQPTQPGAWETIDRRQRLLAGLGLYMLGLVAPLAGIRDSAGMQVRGRSMMGLDPECSVSLTATARAVMEAIAKEWTE